MNPTGIPELPQTQPGSFVSRVRFATVGLLILLVLGVVAGGWYYQNVFRSASDKTFSEIQEEDEVFANAVERIRNNQFLEGRELLETKVSTTQDPVLVGLYNLWIALTYRGDELEFMSRLLEVATNETYSPRTRTYAYALIAEVYSAYPGNDVLDVVFKDSKMLGFQEKKSDGSLDYRSTMIHILDQSAVIVENPLVLARTASILTIGIQRGEISRTELDKVRSLLERARPLEQNLLEEDTKLFYPTYLLMVAQVLDGLDTLEPEVFATTYPAGFVEKAYERALQFAITSSKAYEAVARYGYSFYLINKYEQGRGGAREEVTKMVNSLLQPFSQEEALRSSPMFQLSLTAKSRNDKYIYDRVQKLMIYSPEFKKTLATYAIL